MTQEADKSRRKSGAWETAVHRAATLNLRRISAAKKVASLRHGHHARREVSVWGWENPANLQRRPLCEPVPRIARPRIAWWYALFCECNPLHHG